VDVLTSRLSKINSFRRTNVDASLLRVRAMFVRYALECHQPQEARQRLTEFMANHRSVARDQWRTAETLRETVVQMQDDVLLSRYDQWLTELTTPVSPIELTWHDVAVYPPPAAPDTERLPKLM